MSTTTFDTVDPARDDLTSRSAPTGTFGVTPRRAPRAWALSGAAAAVSGLTAVMISSTAGGVYDTDATVAGNPDRVLAAVNADHPQLFAFHVLAATAAMLLVPFAVGLARRLRTTLPSESLLPAVAAVGVLLTSVALFLGSGLDTEFLLGPHEPGKVVAENVAMYNHWVGTIPWLWTGAGLAGAAVAAAGLRHQAVPRWIGVVGLLLGGLTLLLGVSPLEYMAGLTGPVWMVVTALGFVLGDRAHRA